MKGIAYYNFVNHHIKKEIDDSLGHMLAKAPCSAYITNRKTLV